MAPRPTRSLKYEYELYVDEEIENYKESIPRSVLLGIGDDAVASLAQHSQLALTELLLAQEVDRIIFRRLRLPSYSTWRRRHVKLIAEMRRPEHWGLHPNDIVVRAVRRSGDSRVVLAGPAVEAPALYLAANGCDVTALADDRDVLERVMSAAAAAGLTQRVHTCQTELHAWTPPEPLDAVIVTTAALKGLTTARRARLIEALQVATASGGVHLLQGPAADRTHVTLEELARRYRGWTVTVEDPSGNASTFLARKDPA
ncbi:MAG TPA: hypothetical protein VJU87_00605 [Gemmatimonadaceae bacterium]|nr:hypothetical protein [Gemmatimonadaceae bacterium]